MPVHAFGPRKTGWESLPILLVAEIFISCAKPSYIQCLLFFADSHQTVKTIFAHALEQIGIEVKALSDRTEKLPQLLLFGRSTLPYPVEFV